MARIQNAILACATFFAALGIGFMMQSSPVAEMRYGHQASLGKPPMSLVVDQKLAEDGPFSEISPSELTSIAYTSASSEFVTSGRDARNTSRIAPERPTVASMGRDDLPESVILAAADGGAVHSGALTCVATLEARSVAAAMVDLTLDVPCEPNARVTLHHNGMMVSESTDMNGRLAVQMPALSQAAVYMASFASGRSAMAKAEVTSLDVYDRVVVQWQGPGELQIHALEFGADYGDEGHIWIGAPRDIADAALGKGGFVTRHGRIMPDLELQAQVYTFPSGTSATLGNVALTVETEVSADTCGRQLEGQALQITGGGALGVTDLTVDMPGCEAIGDFLVLKNLLQDLKIARN
ncbi:hypothetical protein K7H22_02875 [Seohaeicola saemankumensis]|uniref:hypothetical protein n=1 Tax=Seohaeicola saemankumensis TaxID=481181 RepID=UPI001E588732|nr:hypothetical protein [Seohaeicola saemankumensis]MCD1624933.1 hypothetical protein [Seohaeicola saemankumensis]